MNYLTDSNVTLYQLVEYVNATYNVSIRHTDLMRRNMPQWLATPGFGAVATSEFQLNRGNRGGVQTVKTYLLTKHQADIVMQHLTHTAKYGIKPTAPSQVYVIRVVGTNICKVGRSTHPSRRMCDMQVGNHRTLELVGSVPVDNGHACESDTHDGISDTHIRGEWYELTPLQIKEILSTT